MIGTFQAVFINANADYDVVEEAKRVGHFTVPGLPPGSNTVDNSTNVTVEEAKLGPNIRGIPVGIPGTDLVTIYSQ